MRVIAHHRHTSTGTTALLHHLHGSEELMMVHRLVSLSHCNRGERECTGFDMSSRNKLAVKTLMHVPSADVRVHCLSFCHTVVAFPGRRRHSGGLSTSNCPSNIGQRQRCQALYSSWPEISNGNITGVLRRQLPPWYIVRICHRPF